MEHLIIYSEKDLNQITRPRKGELKLGQKVATLSGQINNWEKELLKSDAKFVLLGLPEDIGVRANFGRPGAYSAWQPALFSLLNTQSNHFYSGEDLLILGHLDFTDLMEKANSLDPKSKQTINELRALVEIIDTRVYQTINTIALSGKIPLVIGGGHNNSYGLLKGCKLNEETILQCLNCDAHSDFRATEGRHSGNGFSYAYKENILNKYAVVGLHESYNSDNVIKQFSQNKDVFYFETFEEIFIKENKSFKEALNNSFRFLGNRNKTGIELDLDAVQNIPSSAKTSSGISANMARQYAYWCGKNLNAAYFHIAEAAPVLSHIKADNKTGKLIAYLLIDFIKGNLEREL